MTAQNMNIADFKVLKSLWKKAGLSLADAHREYHEFCLLLKLNPDSSFVVKEKGQIIGTVMGGFDGKRAWIYHLAVLPEWQKKGVGSILLKKIEETLAHKGAIKIKLGIFTNNLTVTTFYEKHGYKVQNDAIVMGKSI